MNKSRYRACPCRIEWTVGYRKQYYFAASIPFQQCFPSFNAQGRLFQNFMSAVNVLNPGKSKVLSCVEICLCTSKNSYFSSPGWFLIENTYMVPSYIKNI